MAAMEEAEECSAACGFSLTCQEDGAELGDGVVDDGDGDVYLLYNAAAGDDDEEEEYVEQMLSKEASFCCSSSSSMFDAAGGDGDGEDMPSLASEDWFRQARLAAVKWILETRGYFGFGHRTAYLAIAYFDRFCLRRRVDREAMPWAARLLSVACVSVAAKMEEYRSPALAGVAMPWAARLLSVACVSVAAKMEEYRSPALSEFDAGGGHAFCSGSIRRMELLVLSTLGPSTVAAAAILAASSGTPLAKEALVSKMSNISPSCLIDKEHVHACYIMMVGDMNRRSSSKRPLQCSDSNEITTTSTYDSVLVDDVTDTAAFAATMAMNKRLRLEPPRIH
uniref:Cyclin-like domain-containing protein n=1 Tax=Oryza brachyantha TaxID=4533 RepID=J3NEL0_ORYBR